jgi:hypothetical protein
MHVVYEAENLIDAHLVRGRLQGEGVDAFVRGEFLAGAMGELPVSGLVAVCVVSEDVERAHALLAEWRQGDAQAAAEDDDHEPDADAPRFIRA